MNGILASPGHGHGPGPGHGHDQSQGKNDGQGDAQRHGSLNQVDLINSSKKNQVESKSNFNKNFYIQPPKQPMYNVSS